MAEFLLELGVEELPATMVRSAAEQLLALVSAELGAAGLGGDSGKWHATPRRLIVAFDGVLERQPDQVIEKRGPAAKAAYGADGQPTPALLGFCKGAGVSADKAEIRDDYVWVKADVAGKRASEVLGEALPSAIKKISFEKTMRWGSGRTRFSRPVRWIVALLGGKVVPFTLETVSSGNQSRGHRFLSPGEFEVSSFSELMSKLRQASVEPDVEIREAAIRDGAAKLSGGKAVLTDALVAENVYLTEWPVPIRGDFKADFLDLPRPVLITAMAKHEKFFPVLGLDGKITTSFISVTNAGDEETVRKGNQWVLNARFNDAKFFYDEDCRHTLAEFLEKTERILFQEKLGTVRMRADRISALAGSIALDLGLSAEEAAHCERAGLYCKADLSCGLVSELPSLQGRVGREYARREGFPEPVCEAIGNHYEPDSLMAISVMCADQADRLAGYLGIGELPTGSSDPYALRKAATMLVEAQAAHESKRGIADWVEAGRRLYSEAGVPVGADVTDALKEILGARYEAMFPEIPYHVREAAWATDWLQPVGAFLARAELLAEISADTEFVRTAKRPANIVEAARKKGIVFGEGAVDASLFDSDEERVLFAAKKGFLESQDDSAHCNDLRGLKPAIDAFFDTVMVMTDNEAVRNNRLRLLSQVDALFRRIGDFGKIVIEGS